MHPKKVSQTLLLGFLIIILPTICEGRVRGLCSNCHTMHNSQEGIDVNFDGPQPALLNDSCLGCHSRTDSVTIENYIGSIIPIVYNNGTQPQTPLAGGNFFWVTPTGGGDRMGHNVLGTTSSWDSLLEIKPPGGATLDGTRMSCAGTTGCHGDKTITGSGNNGSDTLALSGAHHSADSTITGTTIGKSYRFLDGVTGTEDDDWEYTTSTHNTYQGAARTDDTDSPPPPATSISSICARCHTDFHNGATDPVDGGTWGSPWVRHPTDFDMSTGLSNSYIKYPATYNPNIPIAYSDVSNTSKDKIIMCLSCHRAHGSPNESILRWDYRAWPADTSFTNGCNICHTDKD